MRENEQILPEERFRIGRVAGIIGICVNLALFAVKLIVGRSSDSVSVAADAVNNLSDAMSSVLVLAGYVMAAKPADKEHPFGHARMEYLCGLFIAVIVTVLGIETLRSAVGNIFGGNADTGYSVTAVAVMACTALAKVGLAVFYRVLGKRIDSQSLRASAADSIGDVAATCAVIFGMLLTPYLGSRTDGIFGMLIGAYIVVLGVKLIMESAGTLLGTAPDAELVSRVIGGIKKYDGVLGIHDLVIHSYGAGEVFATVHVEVDAERDPLETHDMIDNIEAELMKDQGISMVIHMDPVCLSDPRTNALRETVAQIVLDVSEQTGFSASMHDFRVVWGVTHTNLIFDVAVGDDMPLTDTELSELLSDKIGALDGTYNAVICIDRDYHSTRFGREMK